LLVPQNKCQRDFKNWLPERIGLTAQKGLSTMQRSLAINDNLWMASLKLLIIISLSLILSYSILKANLLFILIFAVILTGCYYFVHERNFIYLVLLLPLEHLIIFDAGFTNFKLIQIVFVLVIASAACRRYIFHQKIRFFEKTDLDLPLLLMLVSYIVSTVFSSYLRDNIREILQLIYLICLFKFFASVLDSKEKLESVLKIWVAGVLVAVINIFSLKLIGTGVIPVISISAKAGISLDFGKALINPVYLAPQLSYSSATVMGMGTPCLALLSLTAIFLLWGFLQKPTEPLGRKMIWSALLLVVFGAFVFSYSRAGIIALLMGFSLLSLAKRKFTNLVLLLLVSLYVVVFPTTIHYRFLESFAPEESSFKNHLTSWNICIEMFRERPLVGFGPGSYTLIGNMYSTHWYDAYDPHSFIFLTAAEEGIIGLLAIGWFTVSLFGRGWKGFWNRKYSDGPRNIQPEVFIALVSCFIFAATTPVFLKGFFWGFMGIAYAAATVSKEDERAVEPV
jgi:O-antigen ligase